VGPAEMKIAALLGKDLAHQLRSAFALFMMLAAPLPVTGLLGLSRRALNNRLQRSPPSEEPNG